MFAENTREPAVAGRFYPAKKTELEEMLAEIYLKEKQAIDFTLAEKEMLGAVVPHAGYMYSAYQAVHFFSLLKKLASPVETFIIINPNHTGYGETIALDSHFSWKTPFGHVEQDHVLMKELGLPYSDSAHEYEHAGEVMLPLLQYFTEAPFKVVMITLSHQNHHNASFLAKQIAIASKKTGRKVMLIASSDFTHFETEKTGKKLDDLVLEQIEKQNSKGVEKVVRENNISVCGFGPVMCLMEFAKIQGRYETQLVARGHSGQVSASEKVVNYLTILFHKSS